MTCDVAPLFFFIIHCWLLRYGKTNSVVKDVLRSALPLARARKSSLHGSHRSTQTSASVDADIRIGRRRHPHQSAQTSASVDADIRIGRRRHPHRSAQTSASVDADIRIGRRRCINRRVWHPCHTHAATSTPSARSHLHAADCVGSVKSRKRHAPKGQKYIAQGSALG